MFKWLDFKKLLPQTLWGQLISLLLLALVISQAITLALFINIRQENDTKLSEDKIISQISKVINGIDKSKNSGRPSRAYLANSSDNELTFRGGKSPIRGKDDRPEYSEYFVKKLTAKLDNNELEIKMVSEDRRNGGQLPLSELPKNIKISIQTLPNFWVNVDRRQVKASLEWIAPLLLTMALMILFIVLIVSWIVRRLTKPLLALTDAAQNLGRGVKVQEIPETGAVDVRRVIRSFNQMNKKITRFVSDRTQMLAAISHDLRTPITSLRLHAEYIKDKELQGKIIPIIEEMRDMTESSLQFSKDSSSVEKTDNVDIASLLETLTADYLDMGAKIELQNFGNYQQVILPMRLQSMKRALRNLIDNGLKYGQQVELNFTVNKTSNTVEITIRDGGTGIDAAEFEQVFEPFYRIEKSRNKDTGGVGLGLSIARGIVQAHGGQIILSNILDGNKTIGLEVKAILPKN
ncbi:MAG: ATP-binding protein [Hyphomicrobiales bacterium]